MLLDAKRNWLPAHNVKQPKECRRIVAALPEWLAKHSYIVTGTRVAGELEYVGDLQDRPNEIIHAAQWMGRHAKQAARHVIDHGRKMTSATGKAARAVGSGVKSATAALGKRAMAAKREVLFDLLEDPALVIGNEFVLTGWD